MYKGILAFAAIFAIAFSTMAGNGSDARWETFELYGETLENSRAFVELNETKGRITGNTGCNRFFASFGSSEGSFKISKTATTRMACLDEKATAAEAAFLRALGEATAIERIDDTLIFLNDDKPLMKCRLFNGTDNSAKLLAAKRWILKSIGSDKIELSKDLPFLNFDREKMSAGGNGGCNVFGGSFEVKNNSIKFGDMFSTMMACEQENRMSIEQRFFDGLRSADRFEINNGRLILYKGDEPVLEFAAADK